MLELRGSFEAAWGARFELTRRLSGVAFEGVDKQSGARVRVKLLGVTHDAPLGAHRFDGGWAVVSPFVPGATLSLVMRTMRGHAHARIYRDALFFGFAPLLCRTVETLHARGEAHGGLHGENVIVQWHDDVFVPTLVDVGASRAAGGQDTWEAADVTCVVRHVGDLLRGAFWQEETSELMFGIGSSLSAVRSAIEAVRLILGSLEDAAPSSVVAARMREVLRISMMEGWHEPARRFLKRVARRLGRMAAYDSASSDHALRLYDPDSVRTLDALLGNVPTPPGFSFEALVKPPSYPSASHV